MRVNIQLEIPIKRSPRLQQVEGMFDLSPAKASTFALTAELPLDAKPWQIGLIVGPSGCGKTTLARELFGGGSCGGTDWPADASIVDGFPRSLSIQDVTGLLSSVGFSSPPAWCRPFRVLSNGEQFRVTVARALAEALATNAIVATNANVATHPPVVIDEFTSVVDRTVAQVGSAAVAKAVRSRPGLRFVAVACHYDIIEWLQPDWTFEPASGTFAWRSLQRRPEIRLEIARSSPDLWDAFRRHHYLNHEIGASARCFVGLVEGRPAVFTAAVHFPHPKRPGWREHRTVCLPDFQGVGLGNAMSETIAAVFAGVTGKPYRSVTSHPAMIRHRRRSPLWRTTRALSRMSSINSGIKSEFGFGSVQARRAKLRESASCSRLTETFEYVGPKRPDLAWLLDAKVPAYGGRLAGRIRAILQPGRAASMPDLERRTGYSSTRLAQVLREMGAKRMTTRGGFAYYLG